VPPVEQDNSSARLPISGETTDRVPDIGVNTFDLSEAGAQQPKPARRKPIRDDRDYSQWLRFSVQLFFAALNVWTSAQFFLWVRWAESGGRAFEVSCPAGVEAGCRLKLASGHVPRMHKAGFFLFTSFLVISFLFRKSFCSWICPVGRVSEYLWKLGRTFHLSRWTDIPLRSLKYLVLSFFAYAVIGVSAASMGDFFNRPFALAVDVRVLNFFRYLSGTAAWAVFGLVIASIHPCQNPLPGAQ